MSLARGFLSDGKPNIFVIDHLKLYLFYSAANREAFLLARDKAIADAKGHWAVLSKDLTGPDPEPAVAMAVARTEPAEAAPANP